MKILAAIFMVATLGSSGTAGPTVTVLRNPEAGVERSVGPGEVMYSETLVRVGERTSEVVVLLEETAPVQKGHTLLAGTQLVFVTPEVNSPMFLAGALPNVRASCVEKAFQVGQLGGARKFLCFQDINKDGRFERLIVKGYKRAKDFTGVRYAIRTMGEEDLSLRHTFKGELLYQGASGGALTLAYREYTDDLARPAFSQEASYDLNSEGETEVRFKGAVLRVLAAGNAEIRYVVVAPFKW